MSLLIGGDVVPFGNVEELFANGQIEKILGDDLNKIWKSSKYKIFNLECPITDYDKKILKCGPALKCNPKSISTIKKMKPTCVMLANNHIMDYKSNGLLDTLNILDNNNIEWVGVGNNINNLKKSFIIEDDSSKTGIYNCCEIEFSIATKDSCGANPFDAYLIEEELIKLKAQCDYLIVIYHGGKEEYRYPTPELQKRCKKMVDYGANLIICQHTHCIGCYETYNNSTIIYGQGNFIFNYKNNDCWRTSLLININLKNKKIEYIPIYQTENGTRLANETEAKKILEDFEERSKQIQNSDFLENEFSKIANSNLDNYLISMSSFKFILRILKKFFPFIYKRIKYNYLAILNYIECEPHRECIIMGLHNKIKEKEDIK